MKRLKVEHFYLAPKWWITVAPIPLNHTFNTIATLLTVLDWILLTQVIVRGHIILPFRLLQLDVWICTGYDGFRKFCCWVFFLFLQYLKSRVSSSNATHTAAEVQVKTKIYFAEWEKSKGQNLFCRLYMNDLNTKRKIMIKRREASPCQPPPNLSHN